MYHMPRMCRTCLQMSRGDFKFVSLDSVDPLWESNSPNLKDQLISLVPEMKLDNSGEYICTSCFIALRTSYEFKRMCQATEEKFQNHSYKYRRPFGVGPGSAQFHVTLNENCKTSQEVADFRCQNLNYLQADTSIDITEHHLYDANKIVPRKQLNYINNVTQKLPEIDVEVLVREKQPSPVVVDKKVVDEKEVEAPPKKLDSLALRKKYNIGSEISILKTEKNNPSTQALVESLCEEIPFLKDNCINPEGLNCFIRIQILTQDLVKISTCGKYSLDELNSVANSYYFDTLDELLTCQFCTKTFATRHLLQMHEDEHAVDKFFNCPHCDMQFLINGSLEQHLKTIHADLLPPQIIETSEVKSSPESPKIVEEEKEEKNDTVEEVQDRKIEEVVSTESKVEEEVEVKKDFLEGKIEGQGQPEAELEAAVFDPAKFAEQLEISIKKHIEEEVLEPIITSPPIKLNKPFNRLRTLRKKYKNLIKHTVKFNYAACLICKKTCRNKIALNQHCRFVHVPSTSPKYWLNVLATTQLMKPSNPRRIVTRSTKRPSTVNLFKCNICGKTFTEENFLGIHMYVHTPTILSTEHASLMADDGPEIFTCYICGKGFTRERYLKLHNLHVHLCKTTTCKICNRVFKSDFWFDKHRCQLPIMIEPPPIIQEDHKGGYPCNFCNRSFAALRFMKSHRKRMHNDLVKQRVTKHKPSSTNRGESELGNMDLDDPMKLYTVAGSSAFEDEEDVIEILSDNDAFSYISGEEEEEEEEEVESFEEKIIEEPVVSAKIEVKELVSALSITSRRRSVSRSASPKIQCDFCGEFIEENVYDNHIYEHNKLRLQRSSSSRKSDEVVLEESIEKNKIIFKCHICFKSFQRKYHLINHINQHVDGKVRSDETAQSDEENYMSEIERNEKQDGAFQRSLFLANTQGIYECCGRSFKMKAHLYRHFNIKHQYCNEDKQKTRVTVVKTVRPKAEEEDDDDDDDMSLQTRYHMRNSLLSRPSSPSTEDYEPQLTFNSSNKRKSENLEDQAETKKRKLSEVSKRKRTKSEMDRSDSFNSLSNDDLNKLLLKFECHLCDKRFKQKCQLRDHLNVHSGAKPYICEFCIPHRGFTQTSSLYVHYRRVHAEIMKNCQWEVYSKNGACLICTEIFEKHACMFQHIKEHYSENPFECNVCLGQFTMICHFKLHGVDPEDMRSIIIPKIIEEELDEKPETPIEEKKWKPRIRTKVVTSPNTEHESEPELGKNEDNETLQCAACNKTFRDKQQLRFHKKSLAHFQQAQLLKKETGNVEDGGDETSPDTIEGIQNSVKAIMKKISSIKSNKLRCPTCGMEFVKKIHLRRHKRKMHRTVRPKIEETPEVKEETPTNNDEYKISPELEGIETVLIKNEDRTTTNNVDDGKDTTIKHEEECQTNPVKTNELELDSVSKEGEENIINEPTIQPNCTTANDSPKQTFLDHNNASSNGPNESLIFNNCTQQTDLNVEFETSLDVVSSATSNYDSTDPETYPSSDCKKDNGIFEFPSNFSGIKESLEASSDNLESVTKTLSGPEEKIVN